MPTVLELYEKLKPKLGEEEARSLLEFIASSVEQRAATKADLQQAVSSLREELHLAVASLREEMRQGDASLREEMQRAHTSLREEMRQGDASLREELQKVRAELIKWSFAFWVGNVAVLSGILFALLRGAK
jgi:predicted Holliday junction resolvase-like endonuclease